MFEMVIVNTHEQLKQLLQQRHLSQTEFSLPFLPQTYFTCCLPLIFFKFLGVSQKNKASIGGFNNDELLFRIE